ncbi:MAG TPA: lipopolysaccharide heptosyltransferase I [Acidobacteriota bacterium]|nr:lipopolysaccharide heptosyltransferase I [Acidobacteriota bacterium]
MHVLIVRLSSMGDLVQTLPALTDAAKAIPEIRFDWVVDEAWVEVPRWHSSVDRVIPSAHRRWGKNFLASWKSGDFSRFRETIRSTQYDAVVDVQTEWKSAVVARLAKGVRHGLRADSVHEWGAQFAYQKKFSLPENLHSIQRMRSLLSQALNYSFDEKNVDYGIDRSKLLPVSIKIPSAYLVFIHSTSWESKCWPQHYWQDLIARSVADGFHVVLPWGNQREREQAVKLAGDSKSVMVLPELPLSEEASILAGATAVVGGDTGLTHIAAALSVPAVSLYGATDPLLTGALGQHQVHLMSNFECVKCHQTRCTYPKSAAFKPACFVEMTPDRVWIALSELSSATKSRRHEV